MKKLLLMISFACVGGIQLNANVTAAADEPKAEVNENSFDDFQKSFTEFLEQALNEANNEAPVEEANADSSK